MQMEQDPLTFEQRRKFDYYFLEAVRLKERGDMDAAFDMYSHCLEIHPESAATLYELAKFYMYLGQPQKGEECLRKAMNAEPGNYWYKETLAAYYQSKGENAKAIEVIEEIGTTLGRAIAGLINLFNPELIVIGGNIATTKEYLLLPIKSAIQKHSLNIINSDTTIKFSKLGRKAGAIGSCMLSRSKLLGLL